MNNVVVNANGVHVTGDWQQLAGYTNNWNPGSAPMTDANNDGIYELTVNLPAGTYQYKYVNGNAWGGDENAIPAPCNVNNNREMTISANTTLTAYCFNTCGTGCGAQPTYFVTLRVDMTNECNWDSVDVAGSFNGWSGSQKLNASSPAGVYARTFQLTAGTYDFKFRRWYNGSVVWEGIANRQIVVANNTSYAINCFNSTSACVPAPANGDIHFVVDMGGVSVDSAGVWVMGDFTIPAWQSGALQMTNIPGTNRYEVTAPNVCPTNLTYKFVNGNPTATHIEEQFTSEDSACTQANGFGGFDRVYTRLGGNEQLAFGWEACDLPYSCSDHSLTAVPGASGNYNQRINWTAIVGATNHRLQYRMVGSGSWSGVNEVGTQRLIQNLQPGEYEYRVYGVGVTDTSCTEYFSIACATDIAYSTNIFQAAYLDALPASSARVSVFNLSGGKSLYTFELENLSNDSVQVADSRRNFTFTQLSGGNYALRVYDAYGCQADSVTTVLIEALDTAYIPFLISAVNSSPNGFRPLWNRPRQNGVLMPGVSSYQLRVRNETDNQLVNLFSGITDTFFHVNNLTPGKTYRFNVRSRYNPGTGARNSAFSIRRDRNLGAGGNKNEENLEAASALRVYPNPAKEVLYIETTSSAEVRLMDIAGNVVAEESFVNAGQNSLSLEHLAAGVYLVRINEQGKTTTQRLVKH